MAKVLYIDNAETNRERYVTALGNFARLNKTGMPMDVGGLTFPAAKEILMCEKEKEKELSALAKQYDVIVVRNAPKGEIGVTFAEQLRSAGYSKPIVLITTAGEIELSPRLKAANVTYFYDRNNAPTLYDAIQRTLGGGHDAPQKTMRG
jgi:hypothetical protein